MITRASLVASGDQALGLGVRRDDRELVLLEPEGLIDVAQLAAQNRGDGAQHPVARLAAVGVVDAPRPSTSISASENECP